MILVPRHKIDHYLAKGWWDERTLGELFIETALRQPGAPAVADAPNLARLTGRTPLQWTWGELLAEAGRLAAFFAAQGLVKDDVIVVQLPNCVQQHAIYLACALSGIVVSPVPMQYRAHELSHALDITGARMGLTIHHVGNYLAAAHWAALAGRHRSLGQVWAYGDDLPPGVGALDAALAATSPWSAQQLTDHMRAIGLTAHDVLTICWTSGTESRPKGVPRNHNEWRVVGESVVDAGQLPRGARMVIPFPFVNMAGMSTSLVAWLLTGGTLHHHHPFDLPTFIAQLRDEPTDYTVAAPAVLAMLLKEPGRFDGVDLGRLRRIGSGGGPLADWLVEQFAQQFGIEIVNYFGSNEGAALSSTPQDVPDRRERSRCFPRFGVPGHQWSSVNAPRVRTRLVDPDSGVDIREPGRVGELRFQGPAIFSGYYNAPELTERAFDEQGYYRTGDLFEIAGDRGQYYRFCGRHKDIVIRGGMNISAEEVEGLLLSHPGVREVAVIGYPDAVLGERVCAVVVPQPGMVVSLEDLVAHLRGVEEVAAFKWPEKLVLVGELPRNAVGKVLKRELRQRVLPGAAGAEACAEVCP